MSKVKKKESNPSISSTLSSAIFGLTVDVTSESTEVSEVSETISVTSSSSAVVKKRRKKKDGEEQTKQAPEEPVVYLPKPTPGFSGKCMRIASYDIGLRTCSLCIEEYDMSYLTEEKCPDKKSRYVTSTKEATAACKAYVRNVSLYGRVLHLEKRDLGDKKAHFSHKSFHNLYDWVDEVDELLSSCDVILIEQQMLTNHIAQSIMNHLHCYLLTKYCRGNTNTNTNSKPLQVVLYPSKNKTRILGAPLKVEEDGEILSVNKYARKKWSADQVNIILAERGDVDHHTLIFVENKKKKDDLSDVIMQTLSFMVSKAFSMKEPKECKKKK